MAVERADAGWTATLDSEITTSGGTLDEFRFGLPESWSGPFLIEPSIPSEVIDLPNSGAFLYFIRRRQWPERHVCAFTARSKRTAASPFVFPRFAWMAPKQP